MSLHKIRPLLFLALFLFLPFVLSSCTLPSMPDLSGLPGPLGGIFKKKAPEKVPVALDYWGLFNPKEIESSVISEFNKTYPDTTVNYEEKIFKNLADYKETVFTRLKEQTAPDVVLLHVSWIKDAKQFIRPANPALLSGDVFSSTYYPAASDNCVIQGVVYCVPSAYDGLVLVYNKDMFTAKGIYTPPVDWEDFRQYANILMEKEETGVVKVAGAAIGTSRNVAYASDILGLMFAQSGVVVPDTLNTKAASDALSFYTAVAKESGWNNSFVYSPISFSQGKVAMMFAPSWAILDIKESNKLLNIGVAPVPQVPTLENKGLTDANWASFWVLAVSANSKNPDAAWEFVKYYGSKDGQLVRFGAESQFRPFGQPYSVSELENNLQGDEILFPVIQGAKTSKTGIIADRSGNDPFVEVILTAIDSANSGRDTVSAMETAKSSMEALLNVK